MHTSKLHTKCIKRPGSFPSGLPDTHTIWANITCTVSSCGAPPTPTVGENGTSATAALLLTVNGGTAKLVHNMQSTFAELSKNFTDPYLGACFEQLANIWGDLKECGVVYIT